MSRLRGMEWLQRLKTRRESLKSRGQDPIMQLTRKRSKVMLTGGLCKGLPPHPPVVDVANCQDARRNYPPSYLLGLSWPKRATKMPERCPKSRLMSEMALSAVVGSKNAAVTPDQ